MKWEKVTIFISSTFNDMHSERNYLVKNVFPELRDWCEERKLHLVDVDLRWGVTTEDTENHNTVRTCLKNIDDSRPFFLCFLGQRRGWLPPEDKINPETIEDYPKIKTRIGKKSVTELEVDHALLSPLCEDEKEDCLPVKHALFFFRDPEYLKHLNKEQEKIYTNINCKENELLKEIPEEKRVKYVDEKLEEYKDEIIAKSYEDDSSLRLNYYKGKWDKEFIVPELAHLGEEVSKGGFCDFTIANDSLKDVILDQLKEEIANAYPKHMEIKKASELEKELDQQDLFREINTHGFIPREKSFDELDNYLDSDKNGLCVLTGKAGLGKTMLLANYITDLNKRDDLKVYARFSGVSDKSGEQYNIWRNILEEGEIQLPEDKNSLDDWIPNLEKLEINIEKVLENLSKNGKTAIIIDGINQLANGLDMLKWLPNELPTNLKVILSFKEYDEIKELIANLDESISHLEIKGLESDEDKKSIINKYLEQFLKALDDDQINQICKIDGSDNPLLLKILLNELRSHGQYDTLGEQIANFPSNPQEAFQKLLERLEKEETYAKIDSKEITQLIFGLLASSRYGLSEEELIKPIEINYNKHNKQIDEDELKRVINLQLRQVKPFMKRTDGRFDFFYDEFRQSSQEKYKKNKICCNDILAEYFQKKADPKDNLSFEGKNIRPFNELPYHLYKGNKIATLNELLRNYSWIQKKIFKTNIFNILLDYDYINMEDKDNESLKLIKECFRLSSHVLMDDERQLPSQLWGRMFEIKNDEIQDLLIQSQENTNYPWIKPLSQCMNPPGGSLLATFKGHEKSINKVISVLNGEQIVSASDDKTIKIWDSNSGKLLQTLIGHTKEVKSVAYHENKIISASNDKSIKIWNSTNGKLLQTLTWHDKEVNEVITTRDGKIISLSNDDTILIWNENGDILKRLYGHTDRPNSACINYKGDKIISSGYMAIITWDLKTGEQLQKIGDVLGTNAISVTNDGKILAGLMNNSIKIFDMDSGEELKDIKGHNNEVNDVTLFDENRIISASKDKSIKIWDINTYDEISTLRGHTAPVNSLTVLNKDKIASASQDKTINIWNTSSNKEIHSIKHDDCVKDILVTPDESKVVSSSWDGTLKIWDIKTGDELLSIRAHNNKILSIAITPDGRKIVSGSWDGTIKTWDINTGDELLAIRAHSNKISSLAIVPDGSRIVSGSWDRTIKTWDIITGDELSAIRAHDFWILDIAITPDGNKIISASADRSIKIWDLEQGIELLKLTGHNNNVSSVAVTPDGNKIVSGSWDKTIKIWDINSGNELQTLKVHENGINKVALSSNGNEIISSSKDEIKILDFNGNLVSNFKCNSNLEAMSLLGLNIFVGDDDGNIYSLYIESP